MEFKNFEIEVMNIFMTNNYSLGNTERISIVKEIWLGREREDSTFPSLQSTSPRRPMWQQLRMSVPDSLLGSQRSSDQISSTYSGITAPSKRNLTTEEHRAMRKLRDNQSMVVLTADKGVAMVVMDKNDYTDKALTLLIDNRTYSTINKDPTSRLKNKLINTLRDVKQTGGLSD